jgi:polysaccharide export outer membrane protein
VPPTGPFEADQDAIDSTRFWMPISPMKIADCSPIALLTLMAFLKLMAPFKRRAPFKLIIPFGLVAQPRLIAAALLIGSAPFCQAAVTGYSINPGDILEVFVWNEESLTREVLVQPDGAISVPLAGHVQAGGRTVEEIEAALAEQLGRYLKDKPVVTISLRKIDGHKIYVIGKVNRPGEYPINRPTDIMQALALAGGLNAFAAENDINVLRRNGDGSQHAIQFRYGDLKQGQALDSNLFLQSGDVVVVP